MKTILRAFILFSILALSSCDLLTGGADDVTDIPSSNATATPVDGEAAKNLYLEVSEALYEEVDPLQENAEKGISPKSDPPSIKHEFENVSGVKGLTMSGKVEGTISSEMPSDITTATSGSFTNTISMTMTMNGKMENFEVKDPAKDSVTYKISGTIKHIMTMDMTMIMEMGAGNAITPSGTLDFSVDHTSEFSVLKNDGTGARFKLVFNDDPDPINLGMLDPGSGSAPPDPRAAYDKKATLYAYDDDDNVIATTEVGIMDIPWMMGNMMAGGGAPAEGGPGGGDTPPGGGPGGGTGTALVTLLDKVDPDATYAQLEIDFFNAINAERNKATANSAFGSRDTNLDGLARRYARAGAIDKDPMNLKNRIVESGVTCSDMASYGYGGNSVTVAEAMKRWVEDPNGLWLTSMKNSGFTKIGIGMTTGPSEGGVPGPWVWVCVLLVKP